MRCVAHGKVSCEKIQATELRQAKLALVTIHVSVLITTFIAIKIQHEIRQRTLSFLFLQMLRNETIR